MAFIFFVSQSYTAAGHRSCKTRARIVERAMLGSEKKEYTVNRASSSFYSVALGGRRWWGWHRRDDSGDIVQSSRCLFVDYVSCLADALRRN